MLVIFFTNKQLQIGTQNRLYLWIVLSTIIVVIPQTKPTQYHFLTKINAINVFSLRICKMCVIFARYKVILQNVLKLAMLCL